MLNGVLLCKIMNPILKNIKKQFGDELKIIKINIDNNQQVVNKFQVRGDTNIYTFKNNELNGGSR